MVSEYEMKFWELFKFYTLLILDEESKKTRFVDRLNKNIALDIYRAVHPSS